jgi:23S rRNA (cytidine1920-2'-O)/16S rRNA (cytidine1409-2'-O)-methyltransferase
MKSFHARQSRPHSAPLRPTPSPAGRSATIRADTLLVIQKLAQSRTEAQALIEAGHVSWAGGTIGKPAQGLPADTPLTLAREASGRHVSRGGLKLAGALAASGLNVDGWVCLDVGQSTGGFTDCLLRAGAARIIGVDVGHGQLHPRLRDDPRVTAFEGINCRNLARADLGEACPPAGFDLIAVDVSFISLTLVLPRLPALLAPGGHLLPLVKPQFETGPGATGKGGIVRDAARYAEVESKLRAFAASSSLTVSGWFDSPITGSDGNREFFIWMQHAR